ncbi:hypothetical protein [Muninn virus]|nr:hypothetical protein [Muninn virus]
MNLYEYKIIYLNGETESYKVNIQQVAEKDSQLIFYLITPADKNYKKLIIPLSGVKKVEVSKIEEADK